MKSPISENHFAEEGEEPTGEYAEFDVPERKPFQWKNIVAYVLDAALVALVASIITHDIIRYGWEYLSILLGVSFSIFTIISLIVKYGSGKVLRFIDEGDKRDAQLHKDCDHN